MMLSGSVSPVRTTVVLSVVAIVLVGAFVWGWKSLTKPLPGKADASVCVDTPVSKGDKIFPAQVVVTVLNASDREGLAARTISALTDEGFSQGASTNAPKQAGVPRVQIWTTTPHSPAVRLVASWLHGPKIIKRATTHPGVVVVVGEKFPEVSGGKKMVKATFDTTICSPTVD
ncbi:LytR C-terminal domain-containing protein [Nocardioides sp. KR10-350]|uniref:LytR C-terminal domain-containing protein n=1 Tax=Nocardioides cheoyonin TaxID=3156615 RepID=UPI0032B5A570